MLKLRGSSGLIRLPDYGQLKIKDWELFLKESKVFFNEKIENPFVHEETLSDFVQLKLLGIGTYGKVLLVKHDRRDEYFAMKVIEKEKTIKNNHLNHVKTEKLVSQSLNFPLTTYLKYFFQDNSFIYFVMPFIAGGELFGYLRKVRKLDEVQAKFYICQVVLALEYLHFLNLIHRDIKPENILIDHTGYLKLTDFGLCKRLTNLRTYTMCGTPEYIAPEVILNQGYAKSADWWSVGVLMYELVAGRTPFYADNKMKMYKKIINGRYNMSYTFSFELRDLIKNLLQTDLTNRYGNMRNGVNDIKNHKWFEGVNWMSVLNRKARAKYLPNIKSPRDTDDFQGNTWKVPKSAKVDMYAEHFNSF